MKRFLKLSFTGFASLADYKDKRVLNELILAHKHIVPGLKAEDTR
jgi:hypothetical protein